MYIHVLRNDKQDQECHFYFILFLDPEVGGSNPGEYEIKRKKSETYC